jgi:hypothetical protein
MTLALHLVGPEGIPVYAAEIMVILQYLEAFGPPSSFNPTLKYLGVGASSSYMNPTL